MVEAGSNVTLECAATNDTARSIQWIHESVIVSTTPCTSKDARFVAKSVANSCFLTALGNYNIQGPYACRDGELDGKSAQAVAIVMGKILSYKVKQQSHMQQ